MRPGMMKFAVRPSGLKRTMGCAESAGCRRAAASSAVDRCAGLVAATPFTAASACALTVESRAVDEDEHLRAVAARALVVIVGRDHDADARAAGGDVVARGARVGRDAGDVEGARRAELVDQLAAVVRVVLVDDDGRQVASRSDR